MEINQRELNQPFATQIAFLALIGLKGPYRQYNLNEFINNTKTIDNIADVLAGDFAYGGNRIGKVVSNTAGGGERIITVKYGPIERPVGVTPEEWGADFDTLAFETIKHVFSDVLSNEAGEVTPNPWLRLASAGVLFARKVVVNEILLEANVLPIVQGGGATALDFNIGGVSVQKQVNGVDSGAPVVADGSGVVSVPNGNTSAESITFVVSKSGLETVTYGPYIVEAPILIVSMVPAAIQEGGPATALTLSKPGYSVQKKVGGVDSGAPVVGDANGLSTIPNGNTTGQSITFVATKGTESVTFGPFVVLAP